MSVRAKFRVESLSRGGNGLVNIVLSPVMPGDGTDQSVENAQFFKYTPSGEIKMGVLNEAASKQFVLGDEYYVDFSPAPRQVKAA